MGTFDSLSRLLPDSLTPPLAHTEATAQLVPPGAFYVTFGPVRVAGDVRAAIGAEPGHRRMRHHYGAPPTERVGSEQGALLVLADHQVQVLTGDGPLWSRPAGQICDLDAHQHAGFIVVTTSGDGLLLGMQTPVQVPAGARWRTVPAVTNSFSGWDTALAPYRPRIHW